MGDISPTSPMTPASPTSPFHGAIDAMGLRRRFGDVIGGSSPVKDACDREEAAAAAKLEEERQNVEENYRDKLDNFKDLVSKLDQLKSELSYELSELIDKTTTS